jgi:hypothetical protein
MPRGGRSRVRNAMRSIIFSTYLIFPAILVSEVYSSSNRNEYQKQRNNVPAEYSAVDA